MEKDDQRVHSVSRCSECGGDQLVQDYDQGELVCKTCGLVIREQLVDRGPEWRAFTKEEREQRRRVGLPVSYAIYDKGLSTSINRINRDAYGRRLPLSTKLQMLRLRRWQSRTRVASSVERNLSRAMAELDRLADKLHIRTPIKEKAAVVYRKALNAGLVRGRSIAAIVAASLYAACRSTEMPRTLKEVSSATRMGKKDVARCYRLLLRELDIKMPVEDPVRCVSKIANRARLSTRAERRAIKILGLAKKKGIVTGKDPMGLAAAALYLACIREGEETAQRDVAQAANVTEVTVRNRYKDLKRALRKSDAGQRRR